MSYSNFCSKWCQFLTFPLVAVFCVPSAIALWVDTRSELIASYTKELKRHCFQVNLSPGSTDGHHLGYLRQYTGLKPSVSVEKPGFLVLSASPTKPLRNRRGNCLVSQTNSQTASRFNQSTIEFYRSVFGDRIFQRNAHNFPLLPRYHAVVFLFGN